MDCCGIPPLIDPFAISNNGSHIVICSCHCGPHLMRFLEGRLAASAHETDGIGMDGVADVAGVADLPIDVGVLVEPGTSTFCRHFYFKM